MRGVTHDWSVITFIIIPIKSATATAFGQIDVRTPIEAESIQSSLSDKFQRSQNTHWLGWRVLVTTGHLFEYYA